MIFDHSKSNLYNFINKQEGVTYSMNEGITEKHKRKIKTAISGL